MTPAAGSSGTVATTAADVATTMNARFVAGRPSAGTSPRWRKTAVAAIWTAAAGILSDWAGGARLTIRYLGINESGSAHAGNDDRSGRTLTAQWRDPDGGHVEVTLAGAPAALPVTELEAAIEFSSRLAVMVGSRA